MSKTKKKEFQLPYTNRGVGRTLDNGLRACIDWVEVTFKNVSPSALITDILQLDDKVFSLHRGDLGYRQSLGYGSIEIYFDGNEDMGIHLVMKGRGCREYEGYERRTWKELFEIMVSYQASFSRLDIALDDFKGFFTIKNIVRKIKNRQLVSRFKRARNVEDIEIKDGQVKGVTVYYGSTKSDVQIRMYDKLSERTDNNYRVPADIDFWNRTEVQLRNNRAQSIAVIIAEKEDGELTIGQTVCGILSHYLRFTVKGKDSNRSRWKTATFWEKFLNGVDALPLSSIPIETTIEEKEEWLKKQAAPSLAAVYKAYNGDMSQIELIVKDGLHRLKEQDHKLIRRFQEQQSNVVNES